MMRIHLRCWGICVVLAMAATARGAEVGPGVLPGTGALTIEGDLASVMIDGIDRFLLKQIEAAGKEREKEFPKLGMGTKEEELDALRRPLAAMLGVRDARPAKIQMELVVTTDQPALVGKSEQFEAYAIRWRAFGEVHGEGLLLKPVGREPLADVIAIPDADQTPEMIAGLVEGVAPASQFARRLAESGCRVVIPVLIDRHVEKRVAAGRRDGPELSSREFVYRGAFDLGRHVIGYEIQKIQAAVDWFEQDGDKRRIGIFGYGEGGMLALHAAALDPRIKLTCVSGYFGKRDGMWKEPIERNVFGKLTRYGDQELAMMIAVRSPVRELIIEPSRGPEVKIAGKNAAPAVLAQPVAPKDEVQAARMRAEVGLAPEGIVICEDPKDASIIGTEQTLKCFMDTIVRGGQVAAVGKPPVHLRPAFDPSIRQKRQLDELIRHNEAILARCAETRGEFMKKLDTSSVEKFEASAKEYREKFYNELLGRFDLPLAKMNPRTRKVYDTAKFTGYEVVLDVWPDVIAAGVLLLPKDLKAGEKRAVVVCQHGLEGRPKDCIEGDSRSYHAFAARLCERGYIVFAPQNPYIFGDRFRTLVRKANPIGKGLWSIIIPQHQQILNFLKSLDYVDSKRIAFYGLSYGGKTAMRVPAVLTDYCLSICSGDFNEWVLKNASTQYPWTYVWTGEYEIFEWDLGSTFNYAEMAALIAPRPFMVERGHFDGVGVDEWVAFEFAKVRRLYAKMGIADRCTIEWFWGPHTINGKGTFEFLDRWLKRSEK